MCSSAATLAAVLTEEQEAGAAAAVQRWHSLLGWTTDALLPLAAAVPAEWLAAFRDALLFLIGQLLLRDEALCKARECAAGATTVSAAASTTL
jgi:hypothetical protein